MGERYTNTSLHQYKWRKPHVRHFRRLISVERPRVVCEIGFDAGHGAAIWLEGTEVERLNSFDLPFFSFAPYAMAGRALVDALYPTRVVLHDGNSDDTVRAHSLKVQAGAERPCDIWFIDGSHQGRMPAKDLENALGSAARNRTVVIADDCTRRWKDVYNAWAAFYSRNAMKPYSLPDESVQSSRAWAVLPSTTYTYLSYNRQSTGWCAGIWEQAKA